MSAVSAFAAAAAPRGGCVASSSSNMTVKNNNGGHVAAVNHQYARAGGVMGGAGRAGLRRTRTPAARRSGGGSVVYARVSGGERTTTSSKAGSSGSGAGMGNISSQIKDMRAQMEEDEDLNTLMAGLRGSNIDDSDFAADGVDMKVVDMSRIKGGEGDDQLPLYYDPEIIANFWRKRPLAVAQRIVQLTTIGGGFISGIVYDIARKKTEENSVKRAIQLRDIVTSLGPAYIKVGGGLCTS
jgi:aarF domain-containing kinase